MNIRISSRAIRSLGVVGEIVRAFVLIVGCLAIHDFASKRWPGVTQVTLIVVGALTAGTFIWFAVVSPFRDGLREARTAKQTNGRAAT